MKALEELYYAPSCNFVKYPLCTNYVQCLQYLQVLKYSSTYKYLAKYLSISTSTLGKLRKYLSKVQVLSNLYLSVLKYKYSCTWPHVCLGNTPVRCFWLLYTLGTRHSYINLSQTVHFLEHLDFKHQCLQGIMLSRKC